jgi:hypothetical protein
LTCFPRLLRLAHTGWNVGKFGTGKAVPPTAREQVRAVLHTILHTALNLRVVQPPVTKVPLVGRWALGGAERDGWWCRWGGIQQPSPQWPSQSQRPAGWAGVRPSSPSGQMVSRITTTADGKVVAGVADGRSARLGFFEVVRAAGFGGPDGGGAGRLGRSGAEWSVFRGP